MMKVILRILQHITKELFYLKQAGFRTGEQIVNLRIISEKYAQHKNPL